MRRSLVSFLSFATLALGCSAPGPETSTAEQRAQKPDTTLAGHWDVVGSELDGQTRVGTIDIARDDLTVSFGDYSFHFHDDGAADPRAEWTDRSDDTPVTNVIPTGRERTAVDTGIVPLSLGGDWALSDPKRPEAMCVARLDADGFTSRCQNVKIQPDVGDFFAHNPFPYWAYWDQPWVITAWEQAYRSFLEHHVVPGANGDMVGTRVRALPSDFGDLGGEWELVGSGGAFCRAEISGRTFVSTCRGIEGDYSEAAANGTVNVHFETGFASGFTDKGLELLARRVQAR